MYHSDNKNNGTFKVTEDWDFQAKLLLKREFGQLTLRDLNLVIGREDELLFRISIRLNKTRHQVINILRKFKLAQ